MDSISPDIPQKQCPKCKEWKPATPQFFHRGIVRPFGLHSFCKQCRSQRENPLPEPAPEGYKRCSLCKEVKFLNEFYEDVSLLSGHHSWCKICACSESSKASYRKLGLSQDYQTMLSSQNGVCKICGQPPKEGQKLHLDHCHKTGKIRNLLCGSCNRAIGLLKDNPTFLRNAATYLEEWHANEF